MLGDKSPLPEERTRLLTGSVALLAAPLHRAMPIECPIPDDDADYQITVKLSLRGGYLYGPFVTATPVDAPDSSAP